MVWLERKADRYNNTPEAVDLVTADFKEKEIEFYDEVVSSLEGQKQAAKMGQLIMRSSSIPMAH